MATLLHADGRTAALAGPLSLETLQGHVGGSVEVVALSRKGTTWDVLLVDDEGRLKGKPINAAATALYRGDPPRHQNVIVGDAVRCTVRNVGFDDETYE